MTETNGEILERYPDFITEVVKLRELWQTKKGDTFTLSLLTSNKNLKYYDIRKWDIEGIPAYYGLMFLCDNAYILISALEDHLKETANNDIRDTERMQEAPPQNFGFRGSYKGWL